jgi:hypothetical protein
MALLVAASSTSWVNWSALWKIIVLGLLAGAGLPAIFAIGLRFLSLKPAGAVATTAGPDGDRVYAGNVAGLLAAAVCFAIVLAAIGWGIYEIVSSS